jgi:DNA-binding PadR family transcriptional regulator
MRTKQPLGPAEYALLGILLLGPRHAYDLASDLAADSELALVCRVERGLLYSLVRRLEQAELVESTRDEQLNRPARNVLSLTEAGREELFRWLNEPARRIREVRQDFFLKLYFSVRIPEHETAAIVRHQVDTCADELGRFRRQYEEAQSDYTRLVLESKIANAESTLDWLQGHAESLAELAKAPAGMTRTG